MKSPNRRPESFVVTTPAQPARTPLQRLREWQGMAEGAYSANTLRAQKADGAIFQAFCDRRGESFLPADPKSIRAFIEHEVTEGKKPATVRRYIATIGRAHVGAGLLNPCSGEAVRLALKKMGREMSDVEQTWGAVSSALQQCCPRWAARRLAPLPTFALSRIG